MLPAVEVTKSLSNLLKFNNFNCEITEKKVIDYNQVISEKIAKLKEEMNRSQGEQEEAQFIEGLQAAQVEMLIAEETPEELKERADNIIENANEEAQMILNRAKEDADILKEESARAGREQGYQEGHAQAVQELEEQRRQLEEERKLLKENYEKQVAQIEPMLVDAILQVFEKVTYVLGEDKKDLVLHLVNSVLTKSEVSKEFLIKVSDKDYKYLVENREKIYGAVSKKVQIEIIEEPSYKKNQCIVESDSGIYDCSLDVQLENLIETIKVLSCMEE